MKRNLLGALMVWWLTGLVFVALLAATSPARAGLVALTVAAGVWSWFLAVAMWCRHDHRAPNQPFLRLGPAMHLTLARSLATAVLAGALVVVTELREAPLWVLAGLYAFVAIADWFDGRVARSTGFESKLGARLDMEVDGVGTLVAVLLGWRLLKLPDWYLAVGLARYVYLLAETITSRVGGTLQLLPESRARRWIAGWQMGFLAVTLVPIIPAAWTQVAALGFGAVTLLGFLRDGLIRTGILDIGNYDNMIQ